ncbi:hypothetical protein MNBD_GAMMA10-180 [hydrothermal vent metagenome]|uniref:Uncharacterized protein n=1 Tax=hydrothermal vent metagenome TaxID=652676 RepID=A0A3B0XGB8_9ZZZZ
MNPIRMANNTAVVTATAGYEPLDKLPDLEIELRKKKFKGTVVFDLLYFNGLCDNRFIEIIFDGHEFNRASYKISRKIDSVIQAHQNLFFSSHPGLLASSVLSSQEVNNFTKTH